MNHFFSILLKKKHMTLATSSVSWSLYYLILIYILWDLLIIYKKKIGLRSIGKKMGKQPRVL